MMLKLKNKKTEKKTAPEKGTWRHLHCGAIQLGKSQQKKGRKNTNSASSIYVCERENKLLSVWKIITPVGGSRQEKEGERKREDNVGKRGKVKSNGTLRNWWQIKRFVATASENEQTLAKTLTRDTERDRAGGERIGSEWRHTPVKV